jgi:hypothetical protein
MMPARVAEKLKLRAEVQAGQRAEIACKTDARRTSFFGTSDGGRAQAGWHLSGPAKLPRFSCEHPETPDRAPASLENAQH